MPQDFTVPPTSITEQERLAALQQQTIPTPYETGGNPNTAYYRVYNEPAPYIGAGFNDYYSNYAAMVAVGQAERAAKAAGTQLSYEQRLGIAADAGLAYRKYNGIDTSVPKSREQIERDFRTQPSQQNPQNQMSNAAAIAAGVPGNVDPHVLRIAQTEVQLYHQGSQFNPRGGMETEPIAVLNLNEAIERYGGTIIGNNGTYTVYQGPSAMRGTKYVPPATEVLDLTKAVNQYGGTIIGNNGTYTVYRPQLDLTKGEYFLPSQVQGQSEIERNYNTVINVVSNIETSVQLPRSEGYAAMQRGDIVGAIGSGISMFNEVGKGLSAAIESGKQIAYLSTPNLPPIQRFGIEAGISGVAMVAQTAPFVFTAPSMLQSAVSKPIGIPGAAFETVTGMAGNIGAEALIHPGSLPGNIVGLYGGGKVVGSAAAPIVETVRPIVPASPVLLDVGVRVGENRYTTLYAHSVEGTTPVAGFSTGAEGLFKVYRNPATVLGEREFSVGQMFNVRNPSEAIPAAQARVVKPLFEQLAATSQSAGYVSASLALRELIPYSERAIKQTMESPLGTTQIANFNPDVHTRFITEIAEVSGNKFVGSVTLADIVGSRYMRDVRLSDVDVSIPQEAPHNIIQRNIREIVSSNVPELKLQGYQGKFTTIEQEHPFSVMLQGNGKALDVRTFEARTTGGGIANVQTPEYSIESKLSRLSTEGYSVSYAPGRDVIAVAGGKKPATDIMDVIAASRGISKRSYMAGDLSTGVRYEGVARAFEGYLTAKYPESPITFENPLKSSEVQTAKLNLLSREISRSGRVYSGIPVLESDYYGNIPTYNEDVYPRSQISKAGLFGAAGTVAASRRISESDYYGSAGRGNTPALHEVYPVGMGGRKVGGIYPPGTPYPLSREIVSGATGIPRPVEGVRRTRGYPESKSKPIKEIYPDVKPLVKITPTTYPEAIPKIAPEPTGYPTPTKAPSTGIYPVGIVTPDISVIPDVIVTPPLTVTPGRGPVPGIIPQDIITPTKETFPVSSENIVDIKLDNRGFPIRYKKKNYKNPVVTLDYLKDVTKRFSSVGIAKTKRGRKGMW